MNSTKIKVGISLRFSTVNEIWRYFDSGVLFLKSCRKSTLFKFGRLDNFFNMRSYGLNQRVDRTGESIVSVINTVWAKKGHISISNRRVRMMSYLNEIFYFTG